MRPAVGNRGFTLIELMITIVIVAIVITVGVPSFNDFIASQRVRAAASDIMSDLAFARAEAIKESRRAIVEAVDGAGNWKNGWRICIDMNSDGDCDAPGEVRKVQTPVSGRTSVCASPNLDAGIIFRPDGRAFFPSPAFPNMTAVANADGIKVSDNLGDADSTNDRIRTVFVGISGRPSVETQDNNSSTPARGTECPAFP
jgi:type IV fimbrial biogenesis protein FimT